MPVPPVNVTLSARYVNSSAQVATISSSLEISAASLRRQNLWDAVLRNTTRAAAIGVLIMLGAVIASLIQGSLPSIKAFGWGFLTSTSWNPVTEKFGALPAIYGTVVTSIIAMLIGIPVSLGIAIFITELCPRWLKRPISTAIELLAGVPSIIYGIWGLFVLAPILQNDVQPLLIKLFGPVPVLSALFAGPPYGIGMLTAGVILSIMVLPYITSVTRDVFETVPAVLKESAYGLGCTTWEVVRNVVLPYSRTGVIGGVMLGLGRALGETMAVTFVIGNAHKIASSILAPGTTISASIANEFTEADGVLYNSALIELALILFVITFIVLAGARLLLLRMEMKSGSRA
jgi:phosphate transport system permease protein